MDDHQEAKKARGEEDSAEGREVSEGIPEVLETKMAEPGEVEELEEVEEVVQAGPSGTGAEDAEPSSGDDEEDDEDADASVDRRFREEPARVLPAISDVTLFVSAFSFGIKSNPLSSPTQTALPPNENDDSDGEFCECDDGAWDVEKPSASILSGR